MNVLLKTLPDYEVAYIRRTGSYFEPQPHWEQLLSWALENRLFPGEQNFIGVSLDDPAAVAAEKCRHDACVTIPNGFDKKETIQYQILKGGEYALHSFYGQPCELSSAYASVYQEGLAAMAMEPDYSRYCLEFNLNNPAEDPEGKCRVDLYVPVK